MIMLKNLLHFFCEFSMIRKSKITFIFLNRNGYYSNMRFMKYGIITFIIN